MKMSNFRKDSYKVRIVSNSEITTLRNSRSFKEKMERDAKVLKAVGLPKEIEAKGIHFK